MVEALAWSGVFFLIFITAMQGLKKTHQRVEKQMEYFKEEWNGIK